MKHLKQCLFVSTMVVILSCSAPPDNAEKLTAHITITRLSSDEWRVDYTFSRPIEGLILGPPVVSYRTKAWKVLSDNLSLVEENDQEKLISNGQPFLEAQISVSTYSDFPPDNYVPISPFSDGGAAVYLGFFTGEATTENETRPMNVNFRLNGRPGENVLLPEQANHGKPVYAYFGPQEPAELPHTRLIVDPAMPLWLKDTFDQVVPAVTRVFADRLDPDPGEKPLALIAAGELKDFDGYSVKGGAINGQLVMTLRGRNLLQESSDLRQMFEKLTAHELAHLWQENAAYGGFNNKEPWIHEGSAEAMAVAALTETGVWSAADAERFTKDAMKQCQDALGDLSLPDAVDRGNWGAVYSCGYGKFRSKGADVFEIWSVLVNEAKQQDTTYSQAMLDKVLVDLEK